MRLKQIIVAICLFSVVSIFADVNYRVTSSTRLNVRRTPSTTGAVLGTFKSGEEITVISINKGWAKVEFRNSIGYVSSKFITELPKKIVEDVKAEEAEEVVEVIEETTPAEEIPLNIDSAPYVNEVSTPITIGSFLDKKLNLYLAIQGGIGYSNFLWSDGSVNGDMSFSVDLIGQLYFEDKASFIPQNWYSELAIGYDKKGAADFGMNYIHARLYPFGYRIQISPVDIVIKGGVILGIPLSDLSSYSQTWDCDFQCGIGGGFQFEWNSFALGCNIEYDFTQVSSSCNQALNNIAILGTVSYKFAQFGHNRKN